MQCAFEYKTIRQASRWPIVSLGIYIWGCFDYNNYYHKKSPVGKCRYESFINDEVNPYKGDSSELWYVQYIHNKQCPIR